MKRYSLIGTEFEPHHHLREDESGSLVLHADAMYEISQKDRHIAYLESLLVRAEKPHEYTPEHPYHRMGL